jgi:hypothetical protein
MKKSKKIILVFTFVILASVIGSLIISQKSVHGRSGNCYLLDNDEFYIDDAFYGDFDSDGVEDDTRVIAVLDIDFEGDITSYFYLDLYLPSGYCFSFFVTAEIDANGNEIYFIFTTYNTAIENGWYTAKLTGYFVTYDTLYTGTAIMIFDPPGDDGEGDPDITFSIVYTD